MEVLYQSDIGKKKSLARIDWIFLISLGGGFSHFYREENEIQKVIVFTTKVTTMNELRKRKQSFIIFESPPFVCKNSPKLQQAHTASNYIQNKEL